ncbi:MAG: hypothetical protein KKH04_18130 [Proteobacteria bacterium]|nr:hypothetical protein [Pseudomonadota bacterium]
MPIFNPEIETKERKELLELQNERLQIVLNLAYSHVDFYRKKFDEAGVNPDSIKNLEDLQRIPFTTRKDLMDNYPYGMFAVPLRDVVRLQFPMGLYGNPIVIGYTRQDLKIWRELVARIMVGIGITEQDIIQVAFNYGLFLGAIRFNQSAELIGAAVVPTSIALAEVQLRIMRDFRSTVLASTPSFALHIMETMKRKEIDPHTGQTLSAGQEGELVLTTLTTNAYPLLRYRTSEMTTLHYDHCSCGRTMARMDRVLHRTDQMMSVRGINVFPEKIEEVLVGIGIEGVGPGYSLEVMGKQGMNDRLKVLVEASPEIWGTKEERKIALQDVVQLALRRAIGLRVEVELVKNRQ